METLEQKIQECRICGENLTKPLCNSFVCGNSRILLVGESPSPKGWLKSGKAFYDENNNLLGTGKRLNTLLSIIGLTIDDISFTECCKCHIADRKKLLAFSKNCKEYLLEQIEASNCDIILAMGLFPSQALLNIKIKKFNEYVGQKFDIIISDKIKTIIPIYHPSPINPLGVSGNEPIFKELKLWIQKK